jgi:hypothetical protein
MNKLIKSSLAVAALMAVAGLSHAVPILPLASDVTQNRGYVGLVWTLEKSSAVPDVVVGLRHTKTTWESDVTGYDASARFKFNGHMAFDSVRAVYLDGNRSAQVNIGMGYSVTQQSMFGTVGGSTEHLKLGVDYLLKPAKLDPFVEINTLGKPDDVKTPVLQPV